MAIYLSSRRYAAVQWLGPRSMDELLSIIPNEATRNALAFTVDGDGTLHARYVERPFYYDFEPMPVHVGEYVMFLYGDDGGELRIREGGIAFPMSYKAESFERGFIPDPLCAAGSWE